MPTKKKTAKKTIKKVAKKKAPKAFQLPRFNEPELWAEKGKSPATGRSINIWKLAPATDIDATTRCLQQVTSFSFESQLALLQHADYLTKQDPYGALHAQLGLARDQAQHFVDVARLQTNPELFDASVRAALGLRRGRTVKHNVPFFHAHLTSTPRNQLRKALESSVVRLARLVESKNKVGEARRTVGGIPFNDDSPYVLSGVSSGLRRASNDVNPLIHEALGAVFMSAWALNCADAGLDFEDDSFRPTMDDRKDTLVEVINTKTTNRGVVNHAGAGFPEEGVTQAADRARLTKYKDILQFLVSTGNSDWELCMSLCIDALMDCGGTPPFTTKKKKAKTIPKSAPEVEDD